LGENRKLTQVFRIASHFTKTSSFGLNFGDSAKQLVYGFDKEFFIHIIVP
jgi:hypothetical protein